MHDFHRSGGHSRYVAELAAHFRNEHEVHVFANTFHEEPGIIFHRVPAWRANALTLILTFRWNAARLTRGFDGFDIIHDQGLSTSHPHVITAHICNRAWLAARPNAPWKERLFGGIISVLERRQYGDAHAIAVSDRLRQDLETYYGARDNIHVIHHGVDIATFSPSNRALWRKTMRADLGVPEHETLFLFVGDFRKGVEVSLRALERGWLVAVGSTPQALYRALAEELGRADRVIFRSATEEVARYYAAADVLLLPTPYDAFGMVVLEAMAAGLPVIVSEAAGVSELIRDGENGLILRNHSDLAALMERAANTPELGARARETALQHGWDTVARATMAVYEQASRGVRDARRGGK